MKKKYDKKNKNNNQNVKKQSGKIIINLDDSESDSENNIPNTVFSQDKKRNAKIKNYEKEKNQKLIGQKHKSYIMQESQNNILVEKKNKKSKLYKTTNFIINPKSIKKPKVLNDSMLSSDSISDKIDNNGIEKGEDDEDIVVFPYEFTERMIDALSCEFCQGIYIRPYVININECGHIFCLGCIMKMLGNKEIGSCIKCKSQFYIKNIKYSEVTNFYVKTFFPQISNIIEDNKNKLNQFMETEDLKNSNTNTERNDKKYVLKCELRPYKESVLPQNRLPEIIKRYNKFIINLKSENDNIVSILKKEIIRRLNVRLKEEEIELRVQGIEISQFPTFKSLKGYIRPDLDEIFHYCKK